jgi:E3 ubiquitin-protein ligase SHPRH
LTLVNATHVYLCEPLVNTALEVQAISRIHRIGQTRHTTVWLFTISGTVEEAVFTLSTEKRLNFIRKAHQISAQKQTQLISEELLDESNSHELAQSLGRLVDKSSEGEIVQYDDLETLLFNRSE